LPPPGLSVGTPLAAVVVGAPEVVAVLPADDVGATFVFAGGWDVVGAAEVVNAADVDGAAEVVGAGALIGLVIVSPVMIGEVGSGSTGVPWSTESMNAFQMWPGSPAP
jgi:hypothetical protein